MFFFFSFFHAKPVLITSAQGNTSSSFSRHHCSEKVGLGTAPPREGNKRKNNEINKVKSEGKEGPRPSLGEQVINA